ncbi:hypothetical protein KQX54_018230 [Cotesia glomerata]|uniref:Uncharacterized protein n=1 Tax=Cotesia glomerata TaxID=32391 RepID=A0AAV7J067_COTGL|nr:hypothetical protein KQX54_018230 [Cotesia glomerata]
MKHLCSSEGKVMGIDSCVNFCHLLTAILANRDNGPRYHCTDLHGHSECVKVEDSGRVNSEGVNFLAPAPLTLAPAPSRSADP